MNRFLAFLRTISLKQCLLAFIGSAILAFGIYEIHSISDITEGGILGLTLLLEHWFHISPAISSIVLDIFCYFLGWKVLGKSFLLYSAIACGGFSVCYAIYEQFPRIFPAISNMPFAAAIIGAIFVGIGAGLCVKAGSAPGGDDALAMSISSRFHVDIRWVYLISDILVLLMSLTYIPYRRIIYSLLTVFLSGQIIGLIQKFDAKSIIQREKVEKHSIKKGEIK